MRLTMVLLAIGFSIAGPVLSQSPVEFEGPQEEIDAILALFTRWGAARDAGDVDGVVAGYHPDMLIMTRNRAILKGHDGARTFYAENYAEGSNRQLLGAISELRVFGDVAFVVGRFLAIDEDKGVEDPGYYMIVLRKDDAGGWRVYRDIDTPSPDGLELKNKG